MAITYPLAIPTTVTPSTLTFGGEAIVATARSPFTGEVEVQQHDGQFWQGMAVYPPMNRATAEEMLTFLLKLDGQYGTFTMSPPGSTSPRGSAGGTPLVNGATQTGNDLITDGWPNSAAVLLAGDYIQLGTGLTSRLYKVLDDVTSDGTGNATLSLWPRLKTSTSPADNAAIVTSSPVGLFRLTANRTDWSIGRMVTHSTQIEFRSEP